MGLKKKPEGEAWEKFVESWYKGSHQDKLSLCRMFKVSYDVAKHWVSDSGATRKPAEPEPTMTMTVPEILALKPSVNLDFVMFDLETSNLKADFSIVLTAAIKPYGQPSKVFRADRYPTWEKKRADDSMIVADIAAELKTHAIVVTHYGTNFDIPYLRAKMAKRGLEPLPSMFAMDSYQVARQNFQVSSRRLANLSKFFNLGEKEEVAGALWIEAALNGSKEAMDLIVAHNIRDVEILERLACLSFPYLKFIRRL